MTVAAAMVNKLSVLMMRAAPSPLPPRAHAAASARAVKPVISSRSAGRGMDDTGGEGRGLAEGPAGMVLQQKKEKKKRLRVSSSWRLRVPPAPARRLINAPLMQPCRKQNLPVTRRTDPAPPDLPFAAGEGVNSINVRPDTCCCCGSGGMAEGVRGQPPQFTNTAGGRSQNRSMFDLCSCFRSSPTSKAAD